jgi:hypothetical protein
VARFDLTIYPYSLHQPMLCATTSFLSSEILRMPPQNWEVGRVSLAAVGTASPKRIPLHKFSGVHVVSRGVAKRRVSVPNQVMQQKIYESQGPAGSTIRVPSMLRSRCLLKKSSFLLQ